MQGVTDFVLQDATPFAQGSEPHDTNTPGKRRADPTGALMARPLRIAFRHAATSSGEDSMLDLILIAATAGFFSLSWLYVRASERL
jgi:hypothetical protein